MNKINIILSTACAFAVINNSFGMLTKASSIKQIKKIRSASYAASIEASYKAQEREALNKANQEAEARNELLHKIIQQNEDNNKLLEENNYLLRTIFKMQRFAHLLPSEKTLRTPYIDINPIKIQCGLELHEDFRMLRDIYNIQTYHNKNE